ncbi:MAG TPA: hypothetical protein VFG11_08125 [Acidobacteriota bacterium]|nr:hypothetical protein [Acidobacteriota bacterium]
MVGSRHVGVRVVLLAFLFLSIRIRTNPAQDYDSLTPEIPKTWDEEALRTMELPMTDPAASPKYISADYYYRMPVRPVYKTYPVYSPKQEPSGYLDRLKAQEPKILFDATKLKSKEDWIHAGELVFQAPIEFVDSTEALYSLIRTVDWFEKNGVRTTKDGIFPNFRYVVREKGKVELGILSCAHCHTRVMPDGTTLLGAQGNFPDDRAFGYETGLEAKKSEHAEKDLSDMRDFMRRNYAAPWIANDINAQPASMSLEDIVSALEAIPPGVCARQGSSVFSPARIPDLIGVKDHRYLDASGRVQHRSIGDLMRYAALNQGADLLSTYGTFKPKGELRDPSTHSRYSDEQLYALALYVYSLKPPPNPNPSDASAARGKMVFEHSGCTVCHPGPLYTNNELTPVEGFEVPSNHVKTYDILNMTVDTDSTLTLKTRRGSGYYKVPSLMGLWYRGPLEHNGSVATLEDWFDPRRIQDDYVPTGFRGYGIKTRAVKGHTFGLSLSAEERKDLIAFLKTL